MNMKPIAIIAAILLVVAGFTTYQFQNRAPAVNETVAEIAGSTDAAYAPVIVDFSLPDLDGTDRRISDWSGSARILNFWATWCAPCRREIPLLKATQAEHGGEYFQIIGIAVDFPDDVADYARDTQFNYPILVGQEEAIAGAEASGIPFVGMPFTVVLAPDGELLDSYTGEIHQTDIDRIVDVVQKLNAGTLNNAEASAALQSR